MKFITALCIAAGIVMPARAQIKITCGIQSFSIDAKKISAISQIDPQTKVETTTTFYYKLFPDKLKLWMEIKDQVTRSFAWYEIAKKDIDAAASQEIAVYDQQEFTAPVKTLYIKCAKGKKDVHATGYTDWSDKPDAFPGSFIYISSYNEQELENLRKEINIWLKP